MIYALTSAGSTSAAVTVSVAPSVTAQQHSSGGVDPFEAALALALRQGDADGLAQAEGPLEPFLADGGETGRHGPIAPAAARHCGRQLGEHAVGRGAHARSRKVGRGKRRAGRVVHAINADADRNRAHPRLRSRCRRICSRRSGRRLAISSATPFREPRNTAGNRIMQGQRRNKRQLRRDAPADQRQSAAAWRRDCRAPIPTAAAAAAARGLPPGGHPQRAALAAARERQRLGIGRADRLVSDHPCIGAVVVAIRTAISPPRLRLGRAVRDK